MTADCEIYEDRTFFSQVDAKNSQNFFGGEKGRRYTKIQGNILIILEMAKNCAVALPSNIPWKKNVHKKKSSYLVLLLVFAQNNPEQQHHALTHSHTDPHTHSRHLSYSNLPELASPRLTVLPGHMLTNDSITLLPPHYGG